MEIALEKSKTLKACIAGICDFLTEATVRISPNGVELKEMDPAHVCLAELTMPSTAFQEYNVKETVQLGIDLDRLNTILKRAKDSESIKLSLNKDSTELRITLNDSRKFSLPLVPPSEENLRVPNLNFSAKITVPTKILSTCLDDAGIISENVIFEATEDELKLYAKSDNHGVECTIEKENCSEFEVTEQCKSMFTLDYLKSFIKAGNFAENVTLQIGTDIPISLSFKENDEEENTTTLSFLLAPRIENE